MACREDDHLPRADSVSFGCGVQSMALMVLAAEGRFDCRTFLFANTGDDSEHPKTLRYLREIAMPYAEAMGLEVVELRKTYADGRPHPTLYQALMETKAQPIPMRQSGGKPMKRTCTAKWKAEVLARYREKVLGATVENPHVAAIGFSTDEAIRCNENRRAPHERLVFPLVMDFRMTRGDCAAVIRNAGLPVPPKSACWFCPWHSVARWAVVRRDEPERFEKAVEVEVTLSKRNMEKHGEPLFMADNLAPLTTIAPAQDALFYDEDDIALCDVGSCWT